MRENLRLVRGWPTGPAVVSGAFVALAGLGTTVVSSVSLLAGIAVLVVAMAGMLAFMWSAGQMVNHLNHGEPNWAQGGLVGVLTLGLLVGSELVTTFTEPLIVGPVFAVALGAFWAFGLTRWVSWVVRDDSRLPA